MRHKGERNKLCASLRRPESFHKLFILSLLMSSPLRIEKKNMECVRLKNCKQWSPHWCSADLNMRLLIFAHFVMHRPQTGSQMRFPLLYIPLTLVINHNLFAWVPACCSGSLWAVCPCEPSGLAVLGQDYGFVSVNSFLLGKTAVRIVAKESQTGHTKEERLYNCCNISRIDVAPPTINRPLNVYLFLDKMTS